MSRLVFISIPYSHPDPEVVELRIEASRKLSLFLLSDGISSLSPAQIGHDLLKSPNAKDMDTTFDQWGKFSLDILANCDRILFFLLNGFEKSTGMKAEYEYALQLGKDIRFINTNLQEVDNPFV